MLNESSQRNGGFKLLISIFPVALLLLGFFVSLFFNGLGPDPELLPWVIGLVFLSIALGLFSNKVVIKITPISILLSIYLIWLFISPYFSQVFELSRLTSWILLLLPLSYFAISSNTAEITVNTQWKVVYFVLGLFVSYWGVAEYLYFQNRTGGIVIDANVYAGLLLIFLLPVIAQFLIIDKDRKKTLLGLGVYLGFVSFAFFATYSRSGYGCLLIGLVTILTILALSKRMSVLKVVLIFSILFTSNFLVKNYPDQEISIKYSIDIDNDESLNHRADLWGRTFDVWRTGDSKLTGVGFGTFKSYYREHRTKGVGVGQLGEYTHNDYLQFLMEGGAIQFSFVVLLALFGAILFLKYSYFIIKSYRKETTDDNKNLANQTDIITISFLLAASLLFVQALVNFVFYIALFSILIGATFAYAEKAYNSKQQKKTITNQEVSKYKYLISSILLISFLFLCIDIHIRINYFVGGIDSTNDLTIKKYKKADKLAILRPRSYGMARFQSAFIFDALEKNRQPDDLKGLQEYYEQMAGRVLSLNVRDPLIYSYLASYSEMYPDRYATFQVKHQALKAFKNTDDLFIRAIELNPGSFANYYLLKQLYAKIGGNQEKAYNMIKRNIFDERLFTGMPYDSGIVLLNQMTQFADELGKCQHVPLYLKEKKRLLQRAGLQVDNKEPELRNCL